MFKRILSSLLVLVTLVSFLPPKVSAEGTENIQSENETTMEATNSFGSLLVNTLDADPSAGQPAESGSEEPQSGISDLQIEGTTAYAEYYTERPAKLVVAIYTEDGARMLGSGVTEVSPEETQAEVDIQISPMPRYYSAGAFLLDAETNEPLSSEFRTQLYTKAVQDVRAATVDDFDPARVLNLDDSDETNFAVFGENTLLLYESSTYADDEPMAFAQTGEGVYVFENAGPELLALKPGDSFAYAKADGDIVIAKALAVQVTGTTVTITEDPDADLSDVFELVKIESDGDPSQVTYDDTDLDPSLTVSSDVQDFTFPENAICYEGEPETFSSRGTTKDTFSLGFSVDMGETLSGKVSLKGTTEVRMYIKLNYVYTSYKLDTSLEFSGSVNAKVPIPDIKFPAIKIPLAYGARLEIKPSLVFEVTVSGAVTISLTKTVGHAFDSDLGTTQDLGKKPTLKFSVTGGGKLFVGLKIMIQVVFASEKVFAMGGSLKFGGELSLDDTWQSASTTSSSEIHLCAVCLEGEIDSVIAVGLEIKALGDFIKVNVTLAEKKSKLFDAYVSASYQDMGLTKCPHRLYRVSITVTNTAGIPSSGRQYQLYNQDGGKIDEVQYRGDYGQIVGGSIKPSDVNGQVSFYIPNGKYDLCEGDVVVKSFTVHDAEKKLKLQVAPSEVVGRLMLSTDSVGLYVGGDTKPLRAIYNDTMVNANVTNACSWSSSNPGVVRVEQGVLVPVSAGMAWVTATYQNSKGTVSAACQVTVDDHDPTKCGDNLYWNIDDSGTMTITGTGDMWDYYYYMGDRTTAPWFDKKPKKLVVSEGCTSIGASSFSACGSLRSIQLPDTLETISDFAFADCTGLTRIQLPQNLTYLGIRAFMNCTGLSGNLVIPDGVSVIHEGTFEGCTSLSGKLTLPASLDWIDERAFYDCPLTGTLSLPDGLTSIYNEAFNGCKFSGPLKLPASLDTIYYDAFAGIHFTGDLVISEKLAHTSTRYAFTYAHFTGGLKLPESTVSIPDSAFEGASFGGDVTIPGKVTVIDSWAFNSCDIDGKLTLPASLKEIKDHVFANSSIGGDVWYLGTAEDWAKVKIGEENETLTTATIHFSDGTTNKDPANTDNAVKTQGPEADPADTVPEEAIPETVAPETTVPETTVPETTVPETTVPETTVPETTAPAEETDPETTGEPPAEDADIQALAARGFCIAPHGARQTFGTVTPLAAYTGKETVKNGRRTAAFTGLEPGEEYVLIVSLQPGSVAPEDLQYIEQATADANGAVQFTYIPRTDVTALTQLYGISAQRSLTLDREYLALTAGALPEQLTADLTPPEWAGDLVWASDNEEIASVDENGNVTPAAAGTTYISASVTHGRYTLTARCRVDVTEELPNEEVLGVDLGVKKVTAELYSTDYAALDILPRLAQNEIAVFRMAPQDNGAAVTGAYLEDEEARALFDLKVKDDRQLLLVPTRQALDAPAKEIKSSYTSRLVVLIGGVEYRTEDAVTIAVKKSTPKLKGTNLTFNSFYTNQSQALNITGGTVTRIEGELPQWLAMDGTRLTLRNAPASGSAALNLQVYTAEWAIPAQVKLTVKLSRKAPAVKLSKSSVALSDQDSTGVTLRLNCGKETPESLGIRDILLPEGFLSTELDQLTGEFRLIPAGQVPTGKQQIGVRFYNTDSVLYLPLTITAKAPALKLSKSSVSLNGDLGDSITLKVTAAPADLDLTAVVIQNPYDELTVSPVLADGSFTVSVKPGTAPKATYALSLQAPTGKAAKLTVKTLATGQKVTMRLKALGSFDLTYPEKGVALVPALKNYSGALTDIAYSLSLKRGRDTQDVELTDYLTVGEDGLLRLTGQLDARTVCLLTETGKLPDGTAVSATVQVKVTQTAIPLKLSKTSLSLNRALNEWAQVQVTTTAKGYTLGTPGILVTDSRNVPSDGLTVSYAQGTLTLAVNDSTQYGASYKVQLWATDNRKSTLTVKVPAEKASAVVVTAKTTGFIDVIRDTTQIVVTPGYRNYLGYTPLEKQAKILWAADGKNYTQDVTNLFDLTWADDGKLKLRRAGELQLTGKYRLELAVQGTAKPALVNLTLKSGTAKVTAAPAVLYSKDANSLAILQFTSPDGTLNTLHSVELKDAKQRANYAILDFGNGQFALVPQPGAALKSGNVALNLFFTGNTTGKPNATVNVKVEIR